MVALVNSIKYFKKKHHIQVIQILSENIEERDDSLTFLRGQNNSYQNLEKILQVKKIID